MRQSSATPDRGAPAEPGASSGARRGRHATLKGQGFGWRVGWTVVSALVPGAGLLAAGRKRLGLFFLSLFVLGLAGLAALYVIGDPIRIALSLGTDRDRLLLVAAVVVAVGVLWALVMVGTNIALGRLTVPRRGQQAGNVLLVAALVGGIALPAYIGANDALLTRGVIDDVFPSADGDSRAPLQSANPWADLPRVNVLLVGSDAGKGRTGIRPDTLILASVDTTTGDAVLFSLPRNLENAPFPNGTSGNEAWPDGFNCGDTCLLNAVWQWGEENAAKYYPDDAHPGLTATEQAVEGVTGLDINYYAMVNLSGFQSVVDAIGGIRIDVDRKIPIGGGHSQSTGAALPIYGYIKPGANQLLDGYHALWYARSREGSDDYDRMRRQRCVIGAIAKAADPLTLVRSYPALAKSAKNNITTDVPAADLQEWAELALKIKDAGIRSLPFTASVIKPANPDFDKIHELVQDALVPPVEPTPSATASATGSATATPSATPSATATPTADASQAVDVASVC